jgi:hypothetical protein
MLVHTGQIHRFVCFTLKGVALESNEFVYIYYLECARCIARCDSIVIMSVLYILKQKQLVRSIDRRVLGSHRCIDVCAF